MLTLVSSLPVKIRVPSSLNSTVFTQPVWPFNKLCSSYFSMRYLEPTILRCKYSGSEQPLTEISRFIKSSKILMLLWFRTLKVIVSEGVMSCLLWITLMILRQSTELEYGRDNSLKMRRYHHVRWWWYSMMSEGILKGKFKMGCDPLWYRRILAKDMRILPSNVVNERQNIVTGLPKRKFQQNWEQHQAACWTYWHEKLGRSKPAELQYQLYILYYQA